MSIVEEHMFTYSLSSTTGVCIDFFNVFTGFSSIVFFLWFMFVDVAT